MRTASMYRLWHRWLPYLSAAMATAMLVSGVLTAVSLSAYRHEESPQMRAAVEARLQELQAEVKSGGAAALGRPRFRVMLQELPHAGPMLVADASGEVVFSVMPRRAGHVSELTSVEVRRLLAALPPDALEPEQRLLFMAGDALLAEGQHSDVYSYITRLLKDGEGKPVGVIAVAYDRLPAGRSTGGAGPWLRVYTVARPVFAVSLVLFWLSLPAWVLLDARARGERPWLWAALALCGNLVGVITYLVMRSDQRVSCPNCATEVSAAYNTCPHCGERLRPVCLSCHKGLREDWSYCPHCGRALGS